MNQTKTIQELEELLERSEVKNCILEEENSILREHLGQVYTDIETVKKQKEEIDKIMSGKIYKILTKLKRLTKK